MLFERDPCVLPHERNEEPAISDPRRDHTAPLLDSVLDELGRDIVSGVMPPGETFTLREVGERFVVSRTVAREAMRALEQLGLVTSSRRVGITVQPRSQWSALSQTIIAWRLDIEPEARDQLWSLAILRTGVEPIAARLAAQHATQNERNRLLKISTELRQLGEAGLGASEEFLELDVAFHILLLRASGNEMFAALSLSVTAMLKGRTAVGLQPAVPDERAMDGHVELAHAIMAGDSNAAETWAREILNEASEHLSP